MSICSAFFIFLCFAIISFRNLAYFGIFSMSSKSGILTLRDLNKGRKFIKSTSSSFACPLILLGMVHLLCLALCLLDQTPVWHQLDRLMVLFLLHMFVDSFGNLHLFLDELTWWFQFFARSRSNHLYMLFPIFLRILFAFGTLSLTNSFSHRDYPFGI